VKCGRSYFCSDQAVFAHFRQIGTLRIKLGSNHWIAFLRDLLPQLPCVPNLRQTSFGGRRAIRFPNASRFVELFGLGDWCRGGYKLADPMELTK
jgi:hypothetical protein